MRFGNFGDFGADFGLILAVVSRHVVPSTRKSGPLFSGVSAFHCERRPQWECDWCKNSGPSALHPFLTLKLRFLATLFTRQLGSRPPAVKRRRLTMRTPVALAVDSSVSEPASHSARLHRKQGTANRFAMGRRTSSKGQGEAPVAFTGHSLANKSVGLASTVRQNKPQRGIDVDIEASKRNIGRVGAVRVPETESVTVSHAARRHRKQGPVKKPAAGHKKIRRETSVALAARSSENKSASHAARRHSKQGPAKQTAARHQKAGAKLRSNWRCTRR